MKSTKTLLALATVALMAIVASGCGAPAIRALDVEEDGSAFGMHSVRFIADSIGDVVSVNVIKRPQHPTLAMTELGVSVAHREGTRLESLTLAFRPGLFTPVYLEPPNHWLDGMEFLKQDDAATLRVPKLNDVLSRSTVVYTFLVPTEALSEESGGLPLSVTFVLDGSEGTAEFTLKPSAEDEQL